MGTALGLDALMAGRSKRVLAALTPPRLARSASGEAPEPERASPPRPAFDSASKAVSPRCAALKPAIAESHAEKSSAFIEFSSSIPTDSLNQINS